MNGEHATDLLPADLTPWSTTIVDGDLHTAKALVYDPCGFACSQPIPEAESAAYAAHSFTVDGRSIRFRAAKTTPTKVGQFVTVWKRSPGGPIQPFDHTDPIDLFVISTRERDQLGQFVFPTQVLHERGVLATAGTGGKRAFRVYPPWAHTTNRQAAGAQAWQLEHFLPLHRDKPLDAARARMLYHRSAKS
ncbi:MepB family protein [Nocardia suismassiliense]|uniref:MepB family protein n=1 Tax=Nocardia suismassiliense TaxID=2077092 RepID=UPI000D1D7FC9|nr:MepB family protein [Nocardia suismassiliense]